jgi:hypothetical protein
MAALTGTYQLGNLAIPASAPRKVSPLPLTSDPKYADMFRAPKDANPDMAMAYSDYVGSVYGNTPNADPMPWTDWLRREQAKTTGPAAAPPAAPPPPPALPPVFQPPPPPPPSMVSWSDVAPSLLDLGQVGKLYNPDANVMGGFQHQRDDTNSQVGAARTEVGRSTQHGKDTVASLPGQYDQIYAGVNQLLHNAGSQSDAAMAAAGQQGNSAANLAPLDIVNQMTQGNYKAQVPLLQSGFDERATQQNGFLGQLAAQLMGDIDARQNDYTAGLGSARSSALASALQNNNSVSNQAAQFNASGRSQAAQHNADAQNAYDQGNYQLASQLAQQPMDLALKGVSPGMSLADIAAQNKPKDANTTFDINAIASKIPTGKNEVSLPAALQLQQTGFNTDSLTGGAVAAYQDMVKKLTSSANPATTIQQLQAKYPSYARTINLAALNSGAFKDQLGSLAFGS